MRSTGTAEECRPISDAAAGRLRRVVDAHAQVDGRCPVCGTRRRCWPRSWAMATLIVAGRGDRPD